MTKNRFIISGGGTGGHIYPALSIANEINKSFDNPEIKFIGARGKMEMNIIPKYGYKIHGLLISGLQRSFTLKNILLPFKLIISFIQSIIIILSFRPNFVVGTGGFASFPIVFISSIFRIPTLIQEQNSFPGISNRLLSKHTNYISVAYDKMEKYFPSKKIYKTGNPIRESIRSNKNLVNQRNKLNINSNKNKNLKISSDKVFVTDFIDDIDSIYFTSDIIIARSGALTLSELAIVAKPSILIPSPNVAEDHQLKNAKSIEEKDACICIEEKDLDLIFKSKLDLILNDKNLRDDLSYNISKIAMPNASFDIVDLIKKHLKND